MTERDRVASYMVDLALYAARKRAEISYTQQARGRWDGIRNSRDFPEVPHSADCSAFCTWLAWAARRHIRGEAGVDVINGQRWQAGYTGTMIQHGAKHRSTRSTDLWHPGRTFVFYARTGTEPTHVAVFVGDVPGLGKDMVVSHGRDAGPEVWQFDYRRIVQARAYAV